MRHGFNFDEFIAWLKEKFPGCLDTRWNYDLVENIIEYGLRYEIIAQDQFCYWVSNMLPEVEFLDVARFMENNHLTDFTLMDLGRIEYIKDIYES